MGKTSGPKSKEQLETEIKACYSGYRGSVSSDDRQKYFARILDLTLKLCTNYLFSKS